VQGISVMFNTIKESEEVKDRKIGEFMVEYKFTISLLKEDIKQNKSDLQILKKMDCE